MSASMRSDLLAAIAAANQDLLEDLGQPVGRSRRNTSDHATSQGVDTIPLESARGGAVVLSIPPPNTCTLVSARCVMGQCEHPGRTVRR